jgi:hypothetical protein
MQGMEAMPSCEQCPTGCDATGECIDELNGIEQGSGFDPNLPLDDVEPVRDAPIVLPDLPHAHLSRTRRCREGHTRAIHRDSVCRGPIMFTSVALCGAVYAVQGVDAMPSCEHCPSGCDDYGECVDEMPPDLDEHGDEIDAYLPVDEPEPVRADIFLNPLAPLNY